MKTKITVLTVIDEAVSLQVNTKEEMKERISKQRHIDIEAEKIALSCENSIGEYAVELNHITKKGTPSEVICRMANEGEYDLVVISDKGKNSLQKFLLDSTIERVVRHCTKSVLVVK